MALRTREQELALAQVCVDILRGWIADSGLTQGEIADRSDLRPSAVSMVLSKDRIPVQTTIAKLAVGLGKSYEQLKKLAMARLREHAVVSSGEPFLTVGPFVEGLLLYWAARELGLERAPGRPGPVVSVEPWADVLEEVTAEGGTLFCLANRDKAREFARKRQVRLSVFTGWQVRLRPCFCLIAETLPGDPQQSLCSFKELQRGKPNGDLYEVLTTTLAQLNGKIIVVEPDTDMDANVRTLLEHANLQTVEEFIWRAFDDWPKVAPYEVVLTPISSATAAMEGLSRGYFRENTVIVGGSAQLLSAEEYRGAPKLKVLVDDNDLNQVFPRDHDFWSHWCAPINKIVCHTEALKGTIGISEEEHAAVLGRLFTRIYKTSTSETDRIAEWVYEEYKRFGGAGGRLEGKQLLRLIREVVQIEPVDEEEVGFAPL